MRLTDNINGSGKTDKTTDHVPEGRTSGPGRLLIAVYGIFALSATARASFQIATSFADAPLAYSLSAFAAVVYIVATISWQSPVPRGPKLLRSPFALSSSASSWWVR